MASASLALAPDSVVVGWDFSTSGAKCLAFDLSGNVLARVHLDGDQWYGHPEVSGLRERLDPDHATMRQRVTAVVDRGSGQLAWLPPSLPYYNLNGAYASEDLKNF